MAVKGNKVLNLERMMARYLTMKEQISTLTEESKTLGNAIMQKMRENGMDEGHSLKFEEMNGEVEYSFKICTRVNDVNFDYDSIKSKMTKDEFKHVSNLSATIEDFDGFVSFMKENKIKYKDVEPFLKVKKEIKLNAMEDLYKNGFDMKKIKGLYSLRKTEYLSARKKMGK